MTRLTTVTSILALSLAAAAGCAPTVGDAGGDNGSGGGGGGGGGGGSTGPDASCPDVNFMATQVTPSVHLVIDRSGSMSTLLPNTNISRYQAMHDALVGTNGVVGQLQSKAYFAASLFTSDNPCPLLYTTANRAMNNFTQVKNLIESQGPSGNTPTVAAIDQTTAYFAAHPAPMGSPPIMVLATDGLPNSCSGADSSNESVQAAKNAYAAGIRVFILGIAGVNDSFLQSMANAGQGVQQGQPNAKYYTADSPAQLQTAFQQIIGGVVSCELTINGTVDPNQASAGTVTLNGTNLTYGTDWTVVNGTTIKLLGAACDNLKSSSSPQVHASFPCGAVIL